MFKFFKPKIKATLIKNGSQVDIKIKNANAEQILIMLFLTIKQIALYLKVDKRHVMNKLIDLDKQIVRSEKRAQKEIYKNNLKK